MNEIEASRSIGQLIAACGHWEEENVKAWVEEITQLADVTAAEEATESVLKSWTRQGRPPFGIWHEAYLAAARRRREHAEARQAAGAPSISLQEHVTWLRERKAAGNPVRFTDRHGHIVDELDVWDRNRGTAESVIGGGRDAAT